MVPVCTSAGAAQKLVSSFNTSFCSACRCQSSAASRRTSSETHAEQTARVRGETGRVLRHSCACLFWGRVAHTVARAQLLAHAQTHFKERHEEQMARVREDPAAFAAFMRTAGAPEQYFATHRLLYGRTGGAGYGGGLPVDAAPRDLRCSLEEAGCEARALTCSRHIQARN